jgi:hypothetical protein
LEGLTQHEAHLVSGQGWCFMKSLAKRSFIF